VTPDGGPVLSLQGVHKSFADPAGTFPVLQGVDLAVGRGEIVALVGRSGSGKTTLLTLAAGMEQPDAGCVRVLDGDIPAEGRPWSEVGVLPQSLGLLGELTVTENVTLPLRLGGGAPSGADPVELMARLGVGALADRFPDEISLGEQQRTALARAAVVQPRLLLADEPISHQNVAWATVMMELLVDLAAAGTACLLATHNEVAFDAAHRVVELRDGRLRSRADRSPSTPPQFGAG
jgi:putative ABC transport system ATP-binding protein